MMTRHPLWAWKAQPGAVPLSFWNTWQPSRQPGLFLLVLTDVLFIEVILNAFQAGLVERQFFPRRRRRWSP